MSERLSTEEKTVTTTDSVEDQKNDVLEQKQEETPPAPKPADAPEYPPIYSRVIIMVSLYLAMFLIILDQNILSTAIPKITDEFHSIGDIAWYGSAYILTLCAFQLLMGRIYKFYPAKPVFLVTIVLFAIGSAICGSAPNSTALIVGRAVAGLGSSGIFSGVMVIMFHTIPLQERPAWQGGIGGVLALGSVIGPLIGGAFTDGVTWRWCFYINLPVSAVTILVAVFILKMPKQRLGPRPEGILGKIKQLDPIGNFCFFPGIVCLILALQWGGTKYDWDNARVIVLFVVCGIMVLAFAGIQIWKQDEGTLPPRLVKQRSIAAATWFAFFNGAGMMSAAYYLPIWFQAIKNESAFRSGIMLLPMVLSTVVGTVSSGFFVSKIGYYAPFFLLSSVLMAVGAGLISTFSPSTNTGEWIGYQILLGLGFGFGAQQPQNVAQTILNAGDIATGAALVNFVRFLSSAIFLPVAQNIFLNTLVKKLSDLPGIDPKAITDGGATDLRSLATGDDLQTLLVDYNDAIRNVFYLIVASTALTMLGSIFVEWVNLKDRAKQQATGAEKKRSENMDKKEGSV